MVDPRYHCGDCKQAFTVRAFVAREAEKTGRLIICPLCGQKTPHTARVGKIIRETSRPLQSSTMDLPPTQPQLEYIKGLGGNPGTVKNRREAGELISRLKKLKDGEEQ